MLIKQNNWDNYECLGNIGNNEPCQNHILLPVTVHTMGLHRSLSLQWGSPDFVMKQSEIWINF